MADGKKSTKDKSKNWFVRHKVITAILVIIVIAVGSSSMSGSDSSDNVSQGMATKNNNKSAGKTYRFNERADKQDKDIEVLPGETADIGGVKLVVSDVKYKTSLGEFDQAEKGKTYVVANVSLKNDSDETKPYNAFDFRVQTAGGQVLDGAFATTESPLNSGDLVAGGNVKGNIVFEVPVEKGHQYIIWKPGAWSSDRVIVRTK